jgi:UDP-N-acetylglucosamine transferase subunit ALG13
MIFVTVGTTDFDALVQRMDELAPALDEAVVCQVGRGAYKPRHCEYFSFAPSLDPYVRQARLVVSHGGQGSIIDVLRHGRPLIGVSNPDRRDLHQQDILSKFDAENYILWCRTLNELGTSIALAATKVFNKYAEPPCDIHTVINDYLCRAPTSPARWTQVLQRFGR